MLNEIMEFTAYTQNPESEEPRLQPMLLTDLFAEEYKLNGISAVLTIIARGFIFSEQAKKFAGDTDNCILAAKLVLNKWCGFDLANDADTEDEIEKTVNAWFAEEKVTIAWLEKYWTYHYIKKVRKAKEVDAAWKDCKKEWQGKFNASYDYQAKKVTFANVIADAFSLGPLKKRYCIIKKDTVEESSKKRKSKKRDDADLNKAMKRFDYLYSSYKKGTHASTKLKMLKNIIAFLIWQEEHPIWQAKHSGKQQAVLMQKGRLFGWYGRDDSKGDKSAWLLDGFKWKDDRPIMSAESYGTFAKMSIDSNFISENGFEIIDTKRWEDYEEDYWILEDGGHGKKAFVIKNRPFAIK